MVRTAVHAINPMMRMREKILPTEGLRIGKLHKSNIEYTSRFYTWMRCGEPRMLGIKMS
jgi:hypothetical protein